MLHRITLRLALVAILLALCVMVGPATVLPANLIAPSHPDIALMVSSTTAVTFTPVADSYVDSSNPSANHGTSTQIRTDGSPTVNSYLRFSVSSLTATVTRVTLRIHANSSLTSGYAVHAVADNTWSESSLTYKNAPPIAATLGSTGAISSGTWVSVDVTSYITGNGTFSMALTDPSPTALSLASRESSHPPQLVIQTGTSTLASPTPTTAPTKTATPTKTPASQRHVEASQTPTPTKAPTKTATPTSRATKTATPTSGATKTVTPTVNKTATPNPTKTPALASTPPNFGHVYTIVMENKEYSSIVGSSSAPYLNSLIAQYGLATNYTALAHPSQPNYIALFSGSTQGVTTSDVYNLSAKNVVDQIEPSGRKWKVFAQNVPLNCYTGASVSGGEDGSGSYVRRHEPAISFTDISGNATRCANITDFTHFDPAAANYEFIVPNLCNDMHDCSIATGDTFLKGFVPKILNSTAWQNGGVLFITWDEGSTDSGSGGHVATIVIAKDVPAGFRSSTAYNHYSLLRTIQDAWGLGCLANTCAANNMAEFFH